MAIEDTFPIVPGEPAAPAPVLLTEAQVRAQVEADLRPQLEAEIRAQYAPAPVQNPAAPQTMEELYYAQGFDAVAARIREETVASLAPLLQPIAAERFSQSVDPELNADGQEYLRKLVTSIGGVPDASKLAPEVLDAFKRSAKHYQTERAAGRTPSGPVGVAPAANPGMPPQPTLMSPLPANGLTGVTVTAEEKQDPFVMRYIAQYGEARYLDLKSGKIKPQE